MVEAKEAARQAKEAAKEAARQQRITAWHAECENLCSASSEEALYIDVEPVGPLEFKVGSAWALLT
jgi:hypothetical protein